MFLFMFFLAVAVIVTFALSTPVSALVGGPELGLLAPILGY